MKYIFDMFMEAGFLYTHINISNINNADKTYYALNVSAVIELNSNLQYHVYYNNRKYALHDFIQKSKCICIWAYLSQLILKVSAEKKLSLHKNAMRIEKTIL